jgi:hypothetical protein
VLNAEFDIAEHPQLANPDTNQIFPEYVKGIVHGRSPYLAHNMKGTTLISFSMPTVLSSLSNRDVVPVLGIFHGSHAVSMAPFRPCLETSEVSLRHGAICGLALAKHIDHLMNILLYLPFFDKVQLEESTTPYGVALTTWASAILGSRLQAGMRNEGAHGGLRP